MKNFNSNKGNKDQSIISTYLDKDNINSWKNEIWEVKYNKSVLYKKDKTWKNCWLKYGLITPPNENDRSEHLYINTHNSEYRNFKFPTITDIKDYVEKGGSLAFNMKYAEDINSLSQALYDVHSKIDWSWYNDSNAARNFNFIGSIWFTHGWDAKGVNLGRIGWANRWNFNFNKGAFTNHDTPKGYSLLDLRYMLAGSNLINVTFNFSTENEKVAIHNAQGMFKGLQTILNLSVKVDGDKPSSKHIGLSPVVAIEMFKQTGGNITRTPNCIYYSNIHSMSQFLSYSWVCTEIPAFNGNAIGADVDGNVIQLAYPDGKGTYPNFNRVNWKAFGDAPALQVIGPLIDCRYLADGSIFEGSNNVREVRLKNLNGINWNFSNLSKLSQESVVYMLTHLWDRVSKWEEYSHLDAKAKKELLNRTLVHHQNRLTITFHSNCRSYITDELLAKVKAKGWDIVIDNNKL